jgi:hypothetical protein
MKTAPSQLSRLGATSREKMAERISGQAVKVIAEHERGAPHRICTLAGAAELSAQRPAGKTNATAHRAYSPGRCPRDPIPFQLIQVAFPKASKFKFVIAIEPYPAGNSVCLFEVGPTGTPSNRALPDTLRG